MSLSFFSTKNGQTVQCRCAKTCSFTMVLQNFDFVWINTPAHHTLHPSLWKLNIKSRSSFSSQFRILHNFVHHFSRLYFQHRYSTHKTEKLVLFLINPAHEPIINMSDIMELFDVSRPVLILYSGFGVPCTQRTAPPPASSPGQIQQILY